MELVKQNIHMDRIKSSAGTQITLENDVNIPDSRPDAESVVLSKGKIVIEEEKSSDNHVLIRGKLEYSLLVQSETGGLYTVMGELPFEEQVYMEGVVAADTADIAAVLEDMTAGLINSRKLSVQAVVNFSLRVSSLTDVELVTDIGYRPQEEGEVECKKNRESIVKIVMQKKDIFRMKEELELPQNYPNIMELVWSDVQLLNVECKLLEEKISLQGTAQVFIIYESEGEEGRLRTYETVLPFGGTIDCYGCKETMLPSIKAEAGQQSLEARADFDGEERAVGVEVILNLDIRLYEEENVEYVEDVYAIEKEVELAKKEAFFRKLLLCTSDKIKALGQIEAAAKGDGILQILHTKAEVQVDGVKCEEDKIKAEGAIKLQLLLATGENDKPYGRAEGYLPFQYETSLPEGIENCSYELQPVLSTVMTSISGSAGVEAKAIINFNVLAFEDINEAKIAEMKVTEADLEKRSRLPGIVGYIVQEGDELWEIGKRYYVPVSQILEFNNLVGENVRPGEKLLIVKQGRQND